MIEVELLPLTVIIDGRSDISASQIIHVEHLLQENLNMQYCSCCNNNNNNDDYDNEMSKQLELKSRLHLIAVHCGAKLALTYRNNNVINKDNNKCSQRHSYNSYDQHEVCMYDGLICSATSVSRTRHNDKWTTHNNGVTNIYKSNNTIPSNTTSEKNNVFNDNVDEDETDNNTEYNCYYYYYLLEGEYLAVFSFHQSPFAHIAPSLHSMLMLYIMYTSCLKGCSYIPSGKYTNENSWNVEGLDCSLKEKMEHHRKELTKLLHWIVHNLCSALQAISHSAQLAKLLRQLCENHVCGKMYSNSGKMTNLLHELFVNVLPEPMRQLPSCIFTSPVPITTNLTSNNTTRNNNKNNEFHVKSSSSLLDSSARYVLVAMAVWYDGQCLCHTAHDNSIHISDNTFQYKNTNYNVSNKSKYVDYSNVLQLVALHAFMSSCQNHEEEESEHDKFHDSNTITSSSSSSSFHHVMLSLFDHFMINESSPDMRNKDINNKESTECKTTMMKRRGGGDNVEHIGLGFHSTSTHWTAAVILHSTQHLIPTSYFLGHLLPVWMEHFTHINKYILPSPRLYSFLSQLEYLPRSHSYNIAYNKSMNALLTSPPFTSCASLEHIAKHEQFMQLYIIRHDVADHSECILHSWTRQVQQLQQRSHQRSKSVSVAHSSLVADTQQTQENRNQNKSLSISASLSQTQEQNSKRTLQRSSSAPSRSANLTSATFTTNPVLINSSLYTEYDAQVHARHKLRHKFTHLISSSAFMCANNNNSDTKSNEYFTSHGVFSMVRDNHALLLFHATAPPSASHLSSTSLSQHSNNNFNYFYYLIAEIEMDHNNSKDSRNVSATEMYNFAHWLLCRACFSQEHEVYVELDLL